MASHCVHAMQLALIVIMFVSFLKASTFPVEIH